MLDVSQAGAPAGWQELQCLKMQRCACGLLYADAPIGCSVRMRLWAPLCGCACGLLCADAPIGCSLRMRLSAALCGCSELCLRTLLRNLGWESV